MKKSIALIMVCVLLAFALPCNADGGTPLSCDWTMVVNGTDKKVVGDNMVLVYTLELTAQKQGGTTDQGAYTGKAHMTMSFDAAQTSSLSGVATQGFVALDMLADPLSFEVVGYDEEAYSSFAGDDVLAPLVQYDSMALVDAPVTMNGEYSVTSSLHSESGDYLQEEASTLPLKITIDGGQVTVSVDVPWFYGTFHGMVVGTPQ